MAGVLSSFFSNSVADKVSEANLVAPEPYLGEIAIYPYSQVPTGWARCEGQLLNIASNTALFSLLGTTYGGNGQTTFALPDLRGRVIISRGQGPGLPNYLLGQMGGQFSTTLSVGNLPPHSHTASGTVSYPSRNGQGDDTNPNGLYLASAATDLYADTPNGNLGAAPVSVTVNNTGSGLAFDNTQPYLTVGYFIALTGQYPSFN